MDIEIIRQRLRDDRYLIKSHAVVHALKDYLHVVCEYADPIYVEFVTAYIPDEREWESPPFRRLERKKK